MFDYLKFTVGAFFPPLFHRLMSPYLLRWDEEFAPPDERDLARVQNAESGVPKLMAAASDFDGAVQPAK